MAFFDRTLLFSSVSLCIVHVSACAGTVDKTPFNEAETGGTAGTTSKGGSVSSGGTSNRGGSGNRGGATSTGGTTGSGGASSGGSAGLAGSAGSGTAGTGGIPPECRIETKDTAPYSTVFHFVNKSGAKLYLHQACTLDYQVQSCADGYTKPLALAGTCTIACQASSGGCIACGPCLNAPKLIADGTEQTDKWYGNTYTFGTVNQCPCHYEAAAPPGKYRISVPVFVSEADVNARKPAWTVNVDFTLPAPGGQVIVPLQKP